MYVRNWTTEYLKSLSPTTQSTFNQSLPIRNHLYHLSKVKVLITTGGEEPEKLFRVPSHIHYAIPDPLSIIT